MRLPIIIKPHPRLPLLVQRKRLHLLSLPLPPHLPNTQLPPHPRPRKPLPEPPLELRPHRPEQAPQHLQRLQPLLPSRRLALHLRPALQPDVDASELGQEISLVRRQLFQPHGIPPVSPPLAPRVQPLAEQVLELQLPQPVRQQLVQRRRRRRARAEERLGDGEPGQVPPALEGDGLGGVEEARAVAERDGQLLQRGRVRLERSVELARVHFVRARVGRQRHGPRTSRLEDERFEGAGQQEELRQLPYGLGRAVCEAEIVDEGRSVLTRGQGLAVQFRREGYVFDLEFADVVDVEELRQFEGREDGGGGGPAVPEGGGVVAEVEAEEGGRRVGREVVARGRGVEGQLPERVEVFEQVFEVALELEVEVVVVDLEGEGDDAGAQLVLREQDGEELGEFSQAGFVVVAAAAGSSGLAEVDVDEFVDVGAVDVHKFLADERGGC